MSETERMVELINEKLPDMESGTLRFWGDWFGRPYDNWHRIVGCKAPETDLLCIHFNEDEVLSVWSPRDLQIGPSRQRSRPILRITDAVRIRWEWFSYGHPKIEANLCFKEYVRKPAITEPAVEIL